MEQKNKREENVSKKKGQKEKDIKRKIKKYRQYSDRQRKLAIFHVMLVEHLTPHPLISDFYAYFRLGLGLGKRLGQGPKGLDPLQGMEY